MGLIATLITDDDEVMPPTADEQQGRAELFEIYDEWKVRAGGRYDRNRDA